MPAVARQLLALLAKPNFTIPEVSQLIRADAVFAAEVLRLANSAMLGLRYEVMSIMHAISVLGVDRLRGLVLTVAMRRFLGTRSQAHLVKLCWRHNLATALWAESLAEPCGIERADGYAAGLLHDLGRLALIAAYPAEYHAAIEECREAGPGAVWSEGRYLGIELAEANGLIADEWGLPSALRAVLCTCRPPGVGAPGTLFTIPNLAYVACGLADRQGFTVAPHVPEWDEGWAADCLPASVWPGLTPSLEELRESVATRVNLFECEFLTA